MKAVDEAFAWAKVQNQTLKEVLREDWKVKVEDVKAEWMAQFLVAYHDGPPLNAIDSARRALAAVIPLIQKEEREAVLDLVENTPCPGAADDTETGHRYATGYRDASQAARDELRRLRDTIRARGEP